MRNTLVTNYYGNLIVMLFIIFFKSLASGFPYHNFNYKEKAGILKLYFHIWNGEILNWKQ